MTFEVTHTFIVEGPDRDQVMAREWEAWAAREDLEIIRRHRISQGFSITVATVTDGRPATYRPKED